jgi:hypothetical protein
MQSDRRRSERIYIRIPVTLQIEAADRSGSALDLSTRGARVETDSVLVPAQGVGIVPHVKGAHPVSARVAWVKVTGSDRPIEVGLEFLN